MIAWEKFFAFEEENGLFQLEEEGLHIWDIVRHEIYVDFIFEELRDRPSKQRLGEKLIFSVRRIAYLLAFLFRKARPNLFVIYSRDRAADGRFYDKNANDFLQRLQRDSHVIETFEGHSIRYAYPVSLLNPASLFNRFYFHLSRKRDYSALVEKVNAGLGLKWDNRRVNRVISYYKSERLFYSWLLSFKPPGRIYVTNSQQKALFAVARKKGIETIEFQHGLIDQGHICYNYPATAEPGQIYVPDMLLTFSSFWTRDTHYPVKRIIPIGNTVFANLDKYDKPFDPGSKSVGFMSAEVFGLKLVELAIDYALLNKSDTILFKLHPNEFSRVKEYKEVFSSYPNIRVMTNEQPTEEVILSCDAIVLIQSTVAYQALQAGIPVFIYKKMTYYRHAHIFGSPNVRLIENARQIIVTHHATRGPDDIFFERFDESAYHRLSNFT